MNRYFPRILPKICLEVRSHFPKNTINKQIKRVILFGLKKRLPFSPRRSISKTQNSPPKERKQVRRHIYLQEYHTQDLKSINRFLSPFSQKGQVYQSEVPHSSTTSALRFTNIIPLESGDLKIFFHYSLKESSLNINKIPPNIRKHLQKRQKEDMGRINHIMKKNHRPHSTNIYLFT